jgi:nucleoside-diphosphate-sugar epimerase
MSALSAKTVAILGATSQLARDLVLRMEPHYGLQLYARNTAAVENWIAGNLRGGNVAAYPYAEYGRHAHDAVINFVGVGDPARAAEMGAAIFDVTHEFDALALAGLDANPERQYIFLSSGAVYGHAFSAPVDEQTMAAIPMNSLSPADWYGAAKLYAECRHRARQEHAITDVRVFNYFSRTQDLEARFFITDMVRAVRDGSVLTTSPLPMVRDYLHPQDFYQLVQRVLCGPRGNRAIDCYSMAPVSKVDLLTAMEERFGLRHAARADVTATVNATGAKPHYYSLQRVAASLGYQPEFTSLDTVMSETAAILARLGLVSASHQEITR